MQSTANYIEHNNWYNNMFAANIKTEPNSLSPSNETQYNATPSLSTPTAIQLENYFKQHQQQQQQQHQEQFNAMDTNLTALSPSPTNSQTLKANSNEHQQQFFNAAGIQQQHLLQQQQYQQHFQQGQQAGSKNQLSSHLPIGFNPLTPPGLPQAVLPHIPQFYNQPLHQQQQQQQQLLQQQQETPNPQTQVANTEKSNLTPRNTPPMDITPPKSPKAPIKVKNLQQDREVVSNSSEDIKYVGDSEEDEAAIRNPVYNSHGKMKTYTCKTCGDLAVTKLKSWEHARSHMKPEKLLQCPKCPFVTELKHHLEYHTRKHKNIKPFQCDSCSYSCVNKSMLNSHRKSHSSVYQYRCAECDYATKYCHSFKLHLRKYDHKPGIVLDEDGKPNPSVVIDVYGTRRGPKNKGSSGSKKSNSHLSAALRGFAQNQRSASPAKSTSSSVASDLPALTINMSLQQQQQQQQQHHQQQLQAINGKMSPTQQPPHGPIPNILQLIQWQMLAAQQQAAVLAQLSPRMKEQLQNNANNQPNNEFKKDLDDDGELEVNKPENYGNVEEEEDGEEDDRKSLDSAMDLSQGGTPIKENQQKRTPDSAINLKLADETPLHSSSSSNRRKGRVLKLDHEQLKNYFSTPEEETPTDTEMPNASSPIAVPSADESMETGNNPTNNNPSNTSTASSSGNSSNSESTAASSNNSTAHTSPAITPTMYECKYCDILFKDMVLYTIHMGYHSRDDVFKCNMCGEKCDGPVGLFLHMARNAHA